MNDPFESYKLYNALKLHFETDGYDAIKYHIVYLYQFETDTLKIP